MQLIFLGGRTCCYNEMNNVQLYLKHEHSNTCIYRYNTLRNWYDARGYCQSISGDLVKIEDSVLDWYLHNLGTGWIGLRRADKSYDRHNPGFIWAVDDSQVRWCIQF